MRHCDAVFLPVKLLQRRHIIESVCKVCVENSTVLYFGMELKPQVCGKVFDYLIKIYKRREIAKIEADTKKSN